MKILTNFRTDIAKEFKKELEFCGYENIPNDADEIIADYFSAVHKMISAVPRKIKKSDVFSCPEEAAEGLAFLERKIENGYNLRPHQSKAVLDLKKNDLLFYDWGIQHLHLGIGLKKGGFAERSKYVLYVIFTEDSAYFLNVLDHGEWTNTDFLLIIERNWPEIMEPYRMVGFENAVGENAMKELRENRACFLTEANGKVYAPVGGGYSTARTSSDQRFSQTGLWMN